MRLSTGYVMFKATGSDREDLPTRLEASALEKLADVKCLGDLKAATELSASIADAKKTTSEAKNFARQLRLEGLKSFSTILVPIVSLLTLLATVRIQSHQLDEARQENEDKQWRDLLTALKASVKDAGPDVTIAPRIKSFFGSARYAGQAKDISKRVLGQLTYEPGFRDLLETIFGSPNLVEISDTVDIARTLRFTQNGIEARCLNATSPDIVARDDIPTVKFFGLCGNAISDADFAKFVASEKNSDQIIQMRRSYLEVLKEQAVVRDRIVSVFRSNYLEGMPTKERIDVSRVQLQGGDLSGVDFSRFNMSETILNAVKLDGAILTPEK